MVHTVSLGRDLGLRSLFDEEHHAHTGRVSAGRDSRDTDAPTGRTRAKHHVTGEAARVRTDAWLWAVRVYKTRSAATTACRAGHVRVNGERAKAAHPIGPGDEVRARIAGCDRTLVVRRTIIKRVGASVAAEAYEDLTPPPPPRESVAFVPVRDRGAGRPTKRERREIDKLRGY